jgi:hypothetical protein
MQCRRLFAGHYRTGQDQIRVARIHAAKWH